MKIMAVAIFAAAVGVGASAPQIVPTSGPVVTVCIDQLAGDAPDYTARAVASKIFSAIQVRIAWKSGRACQASDAFHVHFTSRTPANLKPGALAFARPYQGDYIEIFYDRVRSTAAPGNVGHLLAYVLVHEITHILQGFAHHSESGIMKAHWSQDDYEEMSVNRLAFAAEDVWLIQLGLKDRAERLEAAADPQECR
jgi:hypothetical protein